MCSGKVNSVEKICIVRLNGQKLLFIINKNYMQTGRSLIKYIQCYNKYINTKAVVQPYVEHS